MAKLFDKIDWNNCYEDIERVFPKLKNQLEELLALERVRPYLMLGKCPPRIYIQFVPSGSVDSNYPVNIPLTSDQEKELSEKADYIGENLAQIATDFKLNIVSGCQIIRFMPAPIGYTIKPDYNEYRR